MLTFQGWVAFITLATLEIVLGIDNVIFVSIAASVLPEESRDRARSIGLFLAMFLRVALLSILTWLAGLTDPWINVFGHDFSKRDLILAGGGAYLIYKAAAEIAEMLRPEHKEEHAEKNKGRAALLAVILQIAIVDVVFAIDSIITAVGMTNQLPIMITAVVAAVMVMMMATKVVSHFIEANPSTKMLALAFLVFVGKILIADGLGYHIDRSYIYVVVGFCIVLEALNIAAKHAQEKFALEQLSDTKNDEDEIKVSQSDDEQE